MFKVFKIIREDKGIKNFENKDISKLRYGMIHCRFGDAEGVAIVMQQVEDVLKKHLKVPRKNIRYLVGTSKKKSWRITENEMISEKHPVNQLMLENYKVGYGGGSSEKIEKAISDTKKVIEDWVRKKRIDVLIAHNTSHPVNFVFSVALSRYYRDAIENGKRTPKYVLWWHDSHLERDSFLNPPRDVENYLLEGVPGPFVEYILFINSLQFKDAQKYFKRLDERNQGFYKNLRINHDVMYNTTDVFIDSSKDLDSNKFNDKVENFLEDFKVKELLKNHRVKLEDTAFVLQPTRVVDRKRIDFALKYSYDLLRKLKEKGQSKAIYFLISGHTSTGGEKIRHDLMKLNKALQKEYKTDKLFLVFAEDYYDKTDLTFEEYPRIIAKLGGVATYFSSIEGFGNNLLEVLASGLVPIVYTYPVFKKDIAKYKFKAIALDKYEVDEAKLEETAKVLKNKTERKKWVDKNLSILKKHFPHKTIAARLVCAVTSPRTHR